MFKKLMMTLALVGLSLPAMAKEAPRVLYMGVNQGPNLLSQHDPAFRRIFDHTGNFLVHENVRLFEEGGNETDAPRTYDEAINLLNQAQRRDLDAAVFISLKHKQQEVSGRKMRDRLVAVAQIVDPHTLELIDTVRIESPTATFKRNHCEEECRDIVMRRHVREILPRFKDQLAARLGSVEVKPVVTKWNHDKVTLTLKGFSPREIRHLEDRIARLETTRDLSALTSRPDKPAFWLERHRDAPDLQGELGGVLASLELSARIIQTANQVTLVKVNRDLASLD